MRTALLDLATDLYFITCPLLANTQRKIEIDVIGAKIDTRGIYVIQKLLEGALTIKII